MKSLGHDLNIEHFPKFWEAVRVHTRENGRTLPDRSLRELANKEGAVTYIGGEYGLNVYLTFADARDAVAFKLKWS